MIIRTSLDDVKIAFLLLRQSTLRHWIDSKWSYLLIILIVAISMAGLFPGFLNFFVQ